MDWNRSAFFVFRWIVLYGFSNRFFQRNGRNKTNVPLQIGDVVFVGQRGENPTVLFIPNFSNGFIFNQHFFLIHVFAFDFPKTFPIR